MKIVDSMLQCAHRNFRGVPNASPLCLVCPNSAAPSLPSNQSVARSQPNPVVVPRAFHDNKHLNHQSLSHMQYSMAHACTWYSMVLLHVQFTLACPCVGDPLTLPNLKFTHWRTSALLDISAKASCLLEICGVLRKDTLWRFSTWQIVKFLGNVFEFFPLPKGMLFAVSTPKTEVFRSLALSSYLNTNSTLFDKAKICIPSKITMEPKNGAFERWFYFSIGVIFRFSH